MSEKRRGLGRGLGALIPDSGTGGTAGVARTRPVDVFFAERAGESTDPSGAPIPPRAAAGVVSAESDERSEVHRAGGPGPGEGEPAGPEGGDGLAPSAGATRDGAASVADGDGLAPVPGARYAEVPLEQIRPNPRQPRTVFDEDDMAELAHSIREIGVLQPVVVRPVRDGEDGVRFELIMGERRWRASREAGRASVPAIVKETEEDDLLRDALLENLHRSQLNALEEAAAYQQLLDDFGCTQEELATRIGRSRPQISNTLRLLRLPPLVARRVAAGVLSAGHARALLAVDDGAAMERLAQRVVAEGLSVRSVEEIVALGVEPERAQRSAPRPGGRHPQLDDITAVVSDHFDTRATITLGARKGRMVLEFASLEDLRRILDQMGVPADR